MKLSSICLLLCAALMLAACGADEPQPAPAAPQKKSEPAAVKPAAQPAQDPEAEATAKMARAVGERKPGAAVDLRYEFASRPEVGVPTQVEVAFIPGAAADALSATISGMDGITVAGPLTPSFEKVEPGKPYTHTFSLLPERSGVYYVAVVVNTRIGDASVARTFSIPFVVGNVAKAEKPQPPTDATGQPIQSMKAQER